MLFVALSAVASVLVSILLKLARRHGLDIGQMVAWNYVSAGLLVALIFSPPLAPLAQPDAPWLTLLALAILLPTIFLALGASVRTAGIAKSDAAQRLSLLLSLAAAFLFFGQTLTPGKGAGIVLGLVALAAIVCKTDGKTVASQDRGAWLYPCLVFVGFGVIDILFKRLAAAGLPLATSLQMMFAMALVVAAAMQAWRIAHHQTRLHWHHAAAGLVLGAFNFGNIYFYLRAHRALAQDPALVFASMNLSVVALGSLVGIVAFGERLSRVNLLGIVMALVAIALLALA